MNRERSPEAVLLDALGTLLELAAPAPRLRAELARRFRAELTLDQAGEAISAEIAYYRRHLNEGREPASLADLRARCAQVLHDALPPQARERVPPGEGLVEALLASLHFDPFPDAAGALSALRARGARLVVVSNWDISLHEVLERVGLAGALDGVITSAEVGSRKPEVAIFERALEVAGVSPRDAIHVGDNPAEDVAGARAAGIEPVLIRRGGARALDGVTTIASLAELV